MHCKHVQFAAQNWRTYPDALLEFIDQVVHEAYEVFVGRQLRHPVLVVGHHQFQLLESVWQDVQNEWRRVLDVHARILAQLHHFVHHFPRFIDSLAVDCYESLRTASVR